MNLLTQFKNIKAFVLDVDGVLTDGCIYAMASDEQVRRMNTKDGYAMQLAVKKGYHVIIISGGVEVGVELRLQRLGITHLHMGVTDKIDVLNKCIADLHLNKDEILYMGDDMPDYEAMQLTGLPCCPADAVDDIKQISTYISPINGGSGCVRDVIEKVMKLNNHWDTGTSIASI